jgi:hypothetical protein
MKKELKIGLVFGTLIMLVAIMYSGNVTACTQYTDMFAGQDWESPAGHVRAFDDDDTHLWVIYDTTATGWEIVDTHVWVGDSWDTLPVNKKGNLRVGHFPYDEKSDECYYITDNVVGYKIPLADIPDGDHPYGEILYIVAHAVVRTWNGEEWEEETSWANTDPVLHRIPGITGWGIYFPFEVGLYGSRS